jgi:SNF2 family DNA or RNA helicase
VTDYTPKSKPFEHQRAEFELSRDMPARALWWEMGCGKTKPTIDTAAWLFLHGKITGVLVMAPKSVAPNWARDEIEKHLPDAVRARTRVLLWNTDKAAQVGFQREMEGALMHDGLLIVCMSYDGIKTEVKPGAKRPDGVRKMRKGFELAKDVLERRPCLMVLDESPRIKDPGAKITKRVLAVGSRAKFRRILSGTPIDNSPFDVYSQVQFLDPFFWRKRGLGGWPAFKTQYGQWVMHLRAPDKCPHPKELRPNCGCPTFPMLVKYQNLEDLHGVMKEVGSRHLKDEVLDLPPKLYTSLHFDLLPPQQELYDKLKHEHMAMMTNGELVTAPLVITQLVRFQQITSGYIRTDDDRLVPVCEGNPRLDLLRDTLEDIPHKVIVWAKFQEDFAQIAAAFIRDGVTFVEYHGATSTSDRELARERFQNDPSVKVFLANPACAGEGLTLTAARTVIYYNTSFRLSHRLQSEARPHRIGQEHPVQYIDLVADRTADERIIEALRDKKDLSDLIMGDPRGNWI